MRLVLMTSAKRLAPEVQFDIREREIGESMVLRMTAILASQTNGLVLVSGLEIDQLESLPVKSSYNGV